MTNQNTQRPISEAEWDDLAGRLEQASSEDLYALAALVRALLRQRAGVASDAAAGQIASS